MVKFKYELFECNNIYFTCTCGIYINGKRLGKLTYTYVDKCCVKEDLKKIELEIFQRFSINKTFKQKTRDALEAQLVMLKLTE